MKTAILTAALIGCATFAFADDDDLSVESINTIGDGTVEIVTRDDGLFVLTRVKCLPLVSAVLDTDNDRHDLSNASNPTLEEMERDTERYEIATAACNNG